MRRCHYLSPGRLDYRSATEMQERCASRLKQGEGEEHLILLEHPPVITLGRNARDTDVLSGPDRLAAEGIAIERTNRGGQVTYHGPGQLVGYPIIDLRPDRRDVGRYLRDLEEVLIRTLRRFGITADRRTGLTGVWTPGGKIASIGVHLSRWVTTHGFALNVSPDLSHFGLIVPCGMRGLGVTSMKVLLGVGPGVDEVAHALVPEFAAVFSREIVAGEDIGSAAALSGVG